MRRVLVRYKVKTERVAENEELVRAVYAELNESDPGGLRYATFKLADGVTFVHIATEEDGSRALAESAAFQRFQAGVRDRCDEPPVVSELEQIGSYGV